MKRKNDDSLGIVYDDLPCWCELLYQNNGSLEPGFFFRLHKDFINSITFKLGESPIVKSFESELNLKAFKTDFSNDFGFDGVFKYLSEKDDFVEFLIKIPQVKIFTDEVCESCEGSGYSEITESKCSFCYGKGKKVVFDWKIPYNISATFSVLTPLIRFFRVKTSASFPQLFTFFTVTKSGMHGGSLSGEVSGYLKEWLSSNYTDGDEVQEITSAMRHVYGTMLGFSKYNDLSFRFTVRNEGGFIAECPGNACGIYPDDMWSTNYKGYRLTCHNVDTPMQQITLLTSLATLSGMVREAKQGSK